MKVHQEFCTCVGSHKAGGKYVGPIGGRMGCGICGLPSATLYINYIRNHPENTDVIERDERHLADRLRDENPVVQVARPRRR